MTANVEKLYLKISRKILLQNYGNEKLITAQFKYTYSENTYV